MNNMQNSHKVLVAVLIVIAAGLGLAVYNRNRPESLKRVDNPTNTNTTNTGTNQQNPPSGQNPTVKDHIDFSALTDAQKQQLFNVPSETASDAEKKAQFALASRVAVATGMLDLNNCTADPVVLSVKLGDSFKVKNSGSQEVKFGFDADKRVSIAVGATVTIKADFKNGVGIYGYGCPDASVNHPIGFIMVQPAS